MVALVVPPDGKKETLLWRKTQRYKAALNLHRARRDFVLFSRQRQSTKLMFFGKRPPICQNSPLAGCALDEMITAAATTWDLIYRDNIIPVKAVVLDTLGRFILVVNVKLGSVSRFQIIGA